MRKLSALLRVADALDFKRQQRVESVNCALDKSKTLIIAASSSFNLDEEIEWAARKGKLIEEVFNVGLSIKKAKLARS